MLFSIIIPAYNASQYINEAIESVLKQDYRMFELLIIDDGSVDDTYDKCKKYAVKDQRIRIIRKKNMGVSAARNEGINNALGEYILFLDADDLLAEHLLTSIHAEISVLGYGPDIVFGDYVRFDENSKQRELYCYNYGSNLENIYGWRIWNVLFGGRQIFTSPIMVQIYRVLFLRENSIYFDENLFVSEDHDWRFLLLTKSERYYYYKGTTYYYRTSNPDSVSRSHMTYRKYSNSHYFLTKWFEIVNQEKSIEQIKNIILKLLAHDYANHAILISQIHDKDEKRLALKLFESKSKILKNSSTLKYKLAYLIFLMFGSRVYIKAINIGHKLSSCSRSYNKF